MTRHVRWLVPSILVFGAVAGVVVAWRSEAPARADGADEVTTGGLRTPVLSIRRAPELVAAPIATRQLVAELDGLSERFPEGTCLAVAGPGLAFAHRADAPMLPASAQKLLTATVALEVLGTEAPVLERVGRVLRDSDNPTTEALVRELGGTTVMAEVLADGGTPHISDGTGHSRDNRVTCQLLVDLLVRPVTGALLVERLAVAGESGTLADRFVDTDLVGVLRAKTGSLTGVAALAGVVEDEDPPLTFALLVNAPAGAPLPADIADLQREVAETLASWPDIANLAALGPEVARG